MKYHIYWSEKLQEWICTNGTLYGGGKTPTEAYDDLLGALEWEVISW